MNETERIAEWMTWWANTIEKLLNEMYVQLSISVAYVETTEIGLCIVLRPRQHSI